MDTADKIGFLPGFGWIANLGSVRTDNPSVFWSVVAFVAYLALRLAICYAITPLGHLAVGLVGEGRVVPVNSDDQFESFWPGDWFLGLAVSVLLTTAAFRLPAEHHWYNSHRCHMIILIGAFAVAFLLTLLEFLQNAYPLWAIFSPTKIYHNFALYGLYGYVAVSTLVAIVGSLFVARPTWGTALTVVMLVVALLCAQPWMARVARDNSLSKANPAALERKASHAHVDNWKFLGIIGPGSNWRPSWPWTPRISRSPAP